MAGGAPAWRKATKPEEYVRGLVEMKVPDGRDRPRTEEEEDGAAAIQTSIKTLIVLAVDAMPPDEATRARDRLRLSYVAALINGVLQARTMHERIEHEMRELREAEKIKRAFAEIRAWGWRFTHPENTIRWRPYEPPTGTPPSREPPAILAEKWTAEDYLAAADFRIFLAKERFALVGVTRQVGSNERGRTDASVRHGVGMMALELARRAPSFNPKRKPLVTAQWKQLVADIANPLFDRDDITEKEVGDWLAVRLKAERERDRIKAENGWWWGYP